MGKKRIFKKIKNNKKPLSQNKNSYAITQRMTYSNIKFIKNFHKNNIIFLKLLQNKKYILACSENKITIHDSKTYEKLSEKKKSHHPFKKIIELTNENIVAISDSEYFFLRIHNDNNSIEDIKEISYMFPQTTSGLFQVNDEIIAIGRDKLIFFYDFIKYENIITLTPEKIVKSCIQLNDKEKMMLISNDSVSFYNLLTYDQIQYIQFNNNEFKKYIFLNFENKKILFYSENFIGIYNIKEGKLIKEIKPKNVISCLIKLKNKNYIVIGGNDGSVFVYDLDSNQDIINYKMGDHLIYEIFELSNNRILFNCSYNEIIISNYINGIVYFKKQSNKISEFINGIFMDNNDLIIGYKKYFIILN